MTTLGERIRTVRGPMSQDAFAKKMGISKGALGFYERNENLPNAQFLTELCQQNSIPPEWILFGKGTLADRDDNQTGSLCLGANTVKDGKSPESGHAEVVFIPMVEAKLSAEQGLFDICHEHEQTYAFPTGFLQRKGNLTAMVLMRVSGDSMEPEIRDGDVVLIDQSQTDPLPGRVFAVSVEGMVYLKIVNATPGKLILTSHNPAYAPVTITMRGGQEGRVRIIGRAVWWCREA